MKKIILIIPVLVLFGIFAVPSLYYNGYIPITNQSMGLSPNMDKPELYSKSTLALEGTITGQTTEVTWVKNGNIDSPHTFTTWAFTWAFLTFSNWPLDVPVLHIPYVYTTWTISTKDFIKGTPTDIVEFKTSGGTYRNIEHVNFDVPQIELGDHVLVFLSKDPPGTRWGNSYYITGVQSGIFFVDSDGNAKTELQDMTVNIDDLKSTLRSMG